MLMLIQIAWHVFFQDPWNMIMFFPEMAMALIDWRKFQIMGRVWFLVLQPRLCFPSDLLYSVRWKNDNSSDWIRSPFKDAREIMENTYAINHEEANNLTRWESALSELSQFQQGPDCMNMVKDSMSKLVNHLKKQISNLNCPCLN
jgi:hypothetical protein